MSKGLGKSKKSTKLRKVNKLTFKELISISDDAYKTFKELKSISDDAYKKCKFAEQKVIIYNKPIYVYINDKFQNKLGYGKKYKNETYENIITDDIKYVINLINKVYSKRVILNSELREFFEQLYKYLDLESRTDNKIDVFSINLNLSLSDNTKKKLNTIVKRIH